MSFSPSFSHSLIQVGIQISFLHHLSNDICAAKIQVISLSQFGILDALLPEGELQHLYSFDQIVINVFLSFQLGGKLVDSSGHLLLLEDELCLAGVVRALLVSKEVHNAVH